MERAVAWHRDDSDETMTTWENVDSCGGFYGREYAVERALEAFESVRQTA